MTINPQSLKWSGQTAPHKKLVDLNVTDNIAEYTGQFGTGLGQGNIDLRFTYWGYKLKEEVVIHSLQDALDLGNPNAGDVLQFSSKIRAYNNLSDEGLPLRTRRLHFGDLSQGETDEEIIQVLNDMRAHDCEMLTLGQYLQPTPQHHPVIRYVSPQEFIKILKL